MTEAQNGDPEVLNRWIPTVPPERLRRIRRFMVVSILAAWGIFVAGLLIGAWSVSKGFPDIRVLRANAHVRQALAKTRAMNENHPSRVDAVTRRPSEAMALADVLDQELGEIQTTHLYPVGQLLEHVPELKTAVKAAVNIHDHGSFWQMRIDARLYELPLEPRQGRPSTPAAQVEAAGKMLPELERRLTELDRAMVTVFPWLGE